MLLVSAAGYIAMAVYFKDQIDMAILSMKVAARALTETPMVFVICAVLQVMWAFYVAFFVYGMMHVGGSQDVNPDTCQLGSNTLTSARTRVGAGGPLQWIGGWVRVDE